MTTAICEWNNVPFAQGRFRYAYKGKWTNNYPRKPGQDCVVKKFKDSYTQDISGWEITVKMQTKAQEMAKKSGCKIEYTDCDVIRCIGSNDAAASVRMNEYVAAEDYLEGDFIKWCNNYGYVSTEARGADHILLAFMHWSWVQSKGQEMIGDIQGVKKPGGGYKLTDPAIMSVTNQYGVTDTGVEGMAMFFLTHKCMPACSSLPKPTLAHFAGKIPDQMLQSALELQLFSKGGTTYTHELKFTDGVRKTIIAAFTAIATQPKQT